VEPDRRYAFDEACVVRMRPGGRPLGRCNLARGPRQLVVLVDEKQVDVAEEAGAAGLRPVAARPSGGRRI